MPQTRQHIEGERPLRQRRTAEGVLMTEEDMQRFLADYAKMNRSEGTVKFYRRKLRRFYEDLPADRTIRQDTLQTWRESLLQSDLLVTDYSPVAFDFAYLRKPVIYYQTDKEEFFSGAHTYEKGYFDYERDGFGEIECSVEALVDRIIEYMKNGCELKEVYRERIDATFPFSDQNNCKRVYEEILKLS